MVSGGAAIERINMEANDTEMMDMRSARYGFFMVVYCDIFWLIISVLILNYCFFF